MDRGKPIADRAAGVRGSETLSIGYFAYSVKRAEPSGASVYVNAMRDGLKARGVGVRLLASQADDGDPDVTFVPRLKGVRRVAGVLDRVRPNVFAGIELRMAIARGAAALMRRRQVSLFEVEEHAGLASLVLRLPRACPVVIRLHGPHFLARQRAGEWDRRDTALDGLEKHVVSRAALVTSPSEDVLRRARQHWGIPLPNAQVIPNATAVVPEGETWARDTAGPILFVGRCDAVKGFDVIVKAFAQIATRHPHRELWLVGPMRELVDGDRRYSTVDSYLADVVADAAIRGRIKYFGQRRKSEIAEYRRRCGVVVVPSRYETFCLAAAEALMAGCPVIAADAGALPELISDGVTGLLFRAGDASALAAALARMLTDPALASRLGDAGQRSARARYAPDVVIPQTLAVYEATVRGARPR